MLKSQIKIKIKIKRPPHVRGHGVGGRVIG